MLNHERNPNRFFGLPNSLVFQIIIGCGFGGMLGIASLWLTPLRVLGVLIATLFAYAVLNRPEIGLLGILIATSSIVVEKQLPVLSIGVGSLSIPDLLLIGLLGLIVVRRLVDPQFRIVRTPLDVPLLAFYSVALISTFIAIFRSSLEIEVARRMIRILSFYLTFFIVTNLVRERRQLHLLLNGIFFLATAVAAAMLAQYVVGASLPFLPGRVETLNTQGVTYVDVARILPPGWSILMVSTVAIFCITVQERFNLLSILRFLQLGLLGIAIAITFIRAYWVGLVLVIFLSVFLVKGYERRRFFGLSIMIFSAFGIILLYSMGSPEARVGKFVTATYSRLETLWNRETINEGSLQWRYVESVYALRSIALHPLLGSGLGSRYRPYDSRIDYRGMSWDARNYIHNGHLWILLDTGLVGYLAFLWLSLAFLARGYRNWRNVPTDLLKGVVLGNTLLYSAALIAALTVPTFTIGNWTPVMGIMMGTNEVILGRFAKGSPPFSELCK